MDGSRQGFFLVREERVALAQERFVPSSRRSPVLRLLLDRVEHPIFEALLVARTSAGATVAGGQHLIEAASPSSVATAATLASAPSRPFRRLLAGRVGAQRAHIAPRRISSAASPGCRFDSPFASFFESCMG